MSSQRSYRLHDREQRPKTLRKHHRDELDTGQVKASAKEPRACSARRLVMGRSQFSARAPIPTNFATETRLVSVAKLVDFEWEQSGYADFIGITSMPCG